MSKNSKEQAQGAQAQVAAEGAAQGKEKEQAPEQAPRFTLEEFAQVVGQATPEQRANLANALGLTGIGQQPQVRKKPHKPTNEDARRLVLSGGDVSHDDDFVPAPPEWVADRGPAFVAAWRQRWAEGRPQSMSNNRMSNEDVEAVAMQASMAGMNMSDDFKI